MHADTSQGSLLKFDIFQNGQLIRSEALAQSSVTIGRGTGSQLVLDGDGVADLHAVIKVTNDGKLRLTDPGDAGVTVNGETVDIRVDLPKSAEIRIGEFTLQFTHAAHTSESAVTTPAAVSSTRVAQAAPEPAPVDLATQAEAALATDLLAELTDVWRKDDDQKVDNKKGKRSLEIREIWGDLLLDVQYFGSGVKAVLLGEHHRPKSHFFVPKERLPSESFSLVVNKNNKWYLRFTNQFRGYVEVNGVQIALTDLIRQGDATPVGGLADTFETPLTEEHRFVVAIGPDILCGTFVLPPKTLPAHFQPDVPFMSLFATLFILSAIGMVLLQRLPPPPEPDVTELPDRFVQLLQKKPEAPKPKKEEKKVEINKPKGQEGAKAKEEEGKKGKKDKKVEKVKGSQVAIDKLKKDREAAQSAGLLAMDSVGGVFGSGGLSSAVTGASGGLSANAIGTTGAGGRGTRGSGGGGGGTAGLGGNGLGTRGGGAGGGGYGGGSGFKGGKKSAKLNMGGKGSMIIGNALDKSLIDKAIRDRSSQIRYCYSRELNNNPRLHGRIVIKFVIGPAGTVTSSSVKSSTMNSATVENCVAERVSRITFPKPKGGVNVPVIYPFNFNAAG